MSENASQFKTCLNPQDYFRQEVDAALEQRKVKTYPAVASYLVQVLTSYMSADHLYKINEENGKRQSEMLAEQWMRAQNADGHVRIELLKKLGDSSLYISGFFGESLKRKLVDVDYYAQLGGSAYSTLASGSHEDMSARIFQEMSQRFLAFVDVFTWISQKSIQQPANDLLRLFDRVATTGSDLAKEELIKQGHIPPAQLKKTSQ